MTTTSKKLVPNKRFPEFEKSGEWVDKKLKEYCDIIVGGDAPEKFSKERTEQFSIPIYSNGVGEKMLYGYTNKARVFDECVTVSARGTIGYTVYHNKPFYPIVRLLCLVPNKLLCTLFLKYQLDIVNIEGTQVGISQLTAPMVSEYHILVPLLNEQQKIADFMSSVDELIKLEQKKLEELQEYKQGLLQNLFPKKNQKVPDLRFQEFKNGDDWKENTISELFDIQMCRRIYKNETSEIGDIPFYKIGTIGRNADAFITKELYDEYRNKYNYPRLKETLITCSGTIGKCIQYNGEKAYFQDSNIVWLRPYFDIINLDYLYIYISNMNWGNLVKTTITRLYTSILKETIIVFPSLKEQQKIADFLLSVDKLIVEQTTKLNLLYDYKKGLLQQLFPN